jgi:hypothetical protein
MLCCDACRQHEVRERMHMGRGLTIAAHLSTRPAPTTAGLSSEAVNDRAPLNSKELRRGGSGHLGPDAPAGQKLITTAVSKAMVQGGRAQGSNLQVHRSHWSQRRPPHDTCSILFFHVQFKEAQTKKQRKKKKKGKGEHTGGRISASISRPVIQVLIQQMRAANLLY